MRILVADDEDVFRRLLVDFLTNEGFDIVEAVNGREALLISQNRDDIDLAILDVMMPEINGMDVCRRIKTSPKPISVLILTAKDRDEDQIEAFESGADDYISKPFSFPIFILRVKSLLKRVDSQDMKAQRIDICGIEIDEERHIVKKNGSVVELTPKEFELLLFLAKNRGIVITRESILSKVWGYDFFGDNRTVDTHIKNIRSKAGNDVIKTVRGYGYVIE